MLHASAVMMMMMMVFAIGKQRTMGGVGGHRLPPLHPSDTSCMSDGGWSEMELKCQITGQMEMAAIDGV